MLTIAILDVYAFPFFLLHIYTFLRMKKKWRNKRNICSKSSCLKI